jgi:hypothetical protein
MARLLEKVSFACRNSEKVKDLSGNDIEVRPTFTFNPESKTSPATAKRWVETNWYGRNKGVFEPITELNSGLVLKITNLEVRSEGGRAYKVIDQFNRQHDLREDQLLECIKREGIAPSSAGPGPHTPPPAPANSWPPTSPTCGAAAASPQASANPDTEATSAASATTGNAPGANSHPTTSSPPTPTADASPPT